MAYVLAKFNTAINT